jgi:hypothetical protein
VTRRRPTDIAVIRLRFIAVEVWRNLSGSPVRTILALFIVLTGGSASLAETYLSAMHARAEQATLLSQGVNIVSLTGANVSGSNCDGLTAVRNVQAAGALRSLGQATVSPGDLSSYFVYEVTPGFFQVMAQPGSTVVGGTLVDQYAATELGLSAPSRRWLQFITTSGTVARNPPGFSALIRVIDLAPRANYYDGSIYILGPASAMYTTCYAALRYPAAEDLPAVLAAELAQHGSVMQADWLGDFTNTESPLESYLARPARWTWPIAGIVAAIVLTVLAWVRAADFALYRATGGSRLAIFFLVMGECLGLALATIVLWPMPLIVIQLSSQTRLDIGAIGAGLASELGYLISFVVIGSILSGTIATIGSPWEQLRRE